MSSAARHSTLSRGLRDVAGLLWGGFLRPRQSHTNRYREPFAHFAGKSCTTTRSPQGQRDARSSRWRGNHRTSRSPRTVATDPWYNWDRRVADRQPQSVGLPAISARMPIRRAAGAHAAALRQTKRASDAEEHSRAIPKRSSTHSTSSRCVHAVASTLRDSAESLAPWSTTRSSRSRRPRSRRIGKTRCGW